MSDLINREDAIDVHCGLCPNQFICCPVDSGNICPDVEVFNVIPPAQPHWIPCSERLPNEGEEVLVTSNSGIFIAVWSKMWDKTIHWFETVEGKSLHKVTAWMPLQKPYGGENDKQT